jgi:hypothetical protein
MQTNEWSFEDGYCRIRTARQRKRERIEDFHKYLRRIYKEVNHLNKLKYQLPLQPLAHPYQKGWLRTFILRPDVAISRQAAFYQELLKKINTVEYSNDKKFRIKKRKWKRKKVWVDKPQYLREFDERSFFSRDCKLTEQEKRLFHREERTYKCTKAVSIHYVFTERWRFILKVMPRIITHIKMVDGTLDGQIQRLDNRITTHHLRHKLWKEINGRVYNYRKNIPRPPDPFKRKSLTTILNEVYNDQQQ